MPTVISEWFPSQSQRKLDVCGFVFSLDSGNENPVHSGGASGHLLPLSAPARNIEQVAETLIWGSENPRGDRFKSRNVHVEVGLFRGGEN